MTSMVAPFQIRNGRVLSTKDPSRVASNKIVNVLTTNRGERVGAPTYGASTSSVLFANVDELELADFKVDAIQELQGRISNVEILNVSIAPDPLEGETYVKINVVYRIPLSSPQVVSFRVAVPGDIAADSPF
jgi:phage baseplate assembly protein W